ncbi:MAG: hypothetical protein J5802_03705 [Butyrivibrio sp.]|nr:hypothetical protein [Butyrivibrio sp.]
MIKRSSIMVALCLLVGVMTGCSSNSNGSLNSKEDASDSASEEISEEPGEVPLEAISEASTDMSAEAISEASSDAASSEASVESKDKETSKKDSDKKDSDKKDSDKKKSDKKDSDKKEKSDVPGVPSVKAGTTRVGDNGIEAYFEWDPVEGANRYEVTVEGRPEGTTGYNVLENNFTTETNYSYSGKLNYDIRIKVRAYSGTIKEGVCGEWSEYAAGNTNDEALATPVVKDAVVTSSGGGNWVLLFEWDSVDGADNYEIVVEEKPKDKSEYTILERTFSNSTRYTYSGPEGNDIRITVKAVKNVWTNGKKKVLSSQPSSYANGKTYTK